MNFAGQQIWRNVLLFLQSVGEEGVVLESDILQAVLPVFDFFPETGLLQICQLFEQSNKHFNPQDDHIKPELVPEPEYAVPTFQVTFSNGIYSLRQEYKG